jgi:hypothetical protein
MTTKISHDDCGGEPRRWGAPRILYSGKRVGAEIVARTSRRAAGAAMPAQCSQKQNPQAIGVLGGFCLKLRPLRRIGDVGGQGLRQSNVTLAAQHHKPLLPFGAMPPHVGVRRLCRAGPRLPFAPRGWRRRSRQRDALMR